MIGSPKGSWFWLTVLAYGPDGAAAVQYGMDLPEPFASEVVEKLTVAKTQMDAIVERLNG